MKKTATDLQLEQARTLLKAKQYDRARDLLLKIDHPMAEQWIDQIDITLSGRMGQVADLRSADAATAPERFGNIVVGDLIRPMDLPRSKPLPVYGFALMVFVALLTAPLLALILINADAVLHVAVLSVWAAAWLGGALLRMAVGVGGVRAPGAAFMVGLLLGAVLLGQYQALRYQDHIAREGLTPAEAQALARDNAGMDGVSAFTLWELMEQPLPLVSSRLFDLQELDADLGSVTEADAVLLVRAVEALGALFIPARAAGAAANRRRQRYARLHGAV